MNLNCLTYYNAIQNSKKGLNNMLIVRLYYINKLTNKSDLSYTVLLYGLLVGQYSEELYWIEYSLIEYRIGFYEV